MILAKLPSPCLSFLSCKLEIISHKVVKGIKLVAEGDMGLRVNIFQDWRTLIMFKCQGKELREGKRGLGI